MIGLPRVVGLVGYARSGKDESYIQGLESRGYKRLGFADALKEEVAQAFDVTVDVVNEQKDMYRPMAPAWQRLTPLGWRH